MNAISEALRGLLALTDPVERDPHSGAAVGLDEDMQRAHDAARAALAAHDAAVAAGGWQVDVAGWSVIVPRTDPHYCDAVIFDIATGLDDSDNAAHLANASRAVECVNACAGIADHAAAIASLRAIAEYAPGGELDSGWIHETASEALK